jgi:hypothetical protein
MYNKDTTSCSCEQRWLNLFIKIRVQAQQDAPTQDLIPKLKMKLKGWCFETMRDIQRESQAVLYNIKKNDFHGTFETLK